MPETARDAEQLYRQVVHLLERGFRTATYKLATMIALVEFCAEADAKEGIGRTTRVPITELARTVVALYWRQVRPFEGVVLKQSTQSRSRIIEAVLALQFVASPDGLKLTIDEAAERAPAMYHRTLDTVGMTLAQQTLPRLQRLAGAARSSPFLYDDSFLNDKVSRAELESRGNAIQLKIGVLENLSAAKRPLLRTLKSMWIDDVLRLNALPADRRKAISSHLFGVDPDLVEAAPAEVAPQGRPGSMVRSESSADSAPTPTTLAERVNHLFESAQQGGQSPSTAEIAAKLRFRGHAISAAYLASLRLGLEKELPRGARVTLARIFDADPGFLLDDEEPASRPERQLDLGVESVHGQTESVGRDTSPTTSSAGGRHRAPDEVAPRARADIMKSPPDTTTLAQRLETLFEQHPGPGGQPLTSAHVAAQLQEDGLPVTESLISRLRAGFENPPSPQALDALAYFFDVDVDYFAGADRPGEFKTAAAESSTEVQESSTRERSQPGVGVNVSMVQIAEVISGLSTAAAGAIERGHVEFGQRLLGVLGAVGLFLGESDGQDISLSPRLLDDIVGTWAPVATSDDPGYATFRALTVRRANAPERSATSSDSSEVTPSPAGEPGLWTLESFIGAVGDPSDKAFLVKLLDLLDAQTLVLGTHAPFAFGSRPAEGLFLYPFRLRYPPFQLLIDPTGRLFIKGNWRTFPTVAGHAGFAVLALALGQDQRGPARGVPVEGLDAEAIWRIAERTARLINS